MLKTVRYVLVTFCRPTSSFYEYRNFQAYCLIWDEINNIKTSPYIGMDVVRMSVSVYASHQSDLFTNERLSIPVRIVMQLAVTSSVVLFNFAQFPPPGECSDSSAKLGPGILAIHALILLPEET